MQMSHGKRRQMGRKLLLRNNQPPVGAEFRSFLWLVSRIKKGFKKKRSYEK